jgi:ribosome-associated toxin RatA of RatAB toxin-antitoxin module
MKSSVEATVEAPAAAVFDLISDIDRLPEWNANMTEVVERPSGELAAGAEWVVEFRAMGQSWRSRSRDLHPATFWRKVLLGPVRHRQLRRSEVPASIAALEAALARAG